MFHNRFMTVSSLGPVCRFWALLMAVVTAAACQTTTVVIDDRAKPMTTERDTDTDTGTESVGVTREVGLDVGIIGYRGVDILVVVDNSSGMYEVQRKLAHLVHGLVGRMTRSMEHLRFEEMRVAVTTTELNLWRNETEITGCENSAVDRPPKNLLEVPCKSTTETVGDCMDRCDAGVEVLCPILNLEDVSFPCEISGADRWQTHSLDHPNEGLNEQAACLVMQGAGGCQVEQPFMSGIRALEDNRDFIVDDHLLVVLVVSDEDDCSTQDPGLYRTATWLGDTLTDGAACFVPPEETETYLYPPDAFVDGLRDLKGGRGDAVLFAAVVGVPPALETPACSGSGASIDESACLEDPGMAISYQEGAFEKACTAESIAAMPGRRYVRAATAMGENGFVHSICDADWQPVANFIVNGVNRSLGYERCYGLDSPLPLRNVSDLSCYGCFLTECELFVEVIVDENYRGTPPCPPVLVDSDEKAYYDRVISSKAGDRFLCPIEPVRVQSKLKSCTELAEQSSSLFDPLTPLWYYCENDLSHPPSAECTSQNRLDCWPRCGAYEVALNNAAKETVEDSDLVLRCPY